MFCWNRKTRVEYVRLRGDLAFVLYLCLAASMDVICKLQLGYRGALRTGSRSSYGSRLKIGPSRVKDGSQFLFSIRIIAQKESCWNFVVRYRATPVPCKCPIILSTTPASFSHPIAAADHSSHGPDLHLIVLLLDPNTDVLNLETARASSATSTLELAALGNNVGFLHGLLVTELH